MEHSQTPRAPANARHNARHAFCKRVSPRSWQGAGRRREGRSFLCFLPPRFQPGRERICRASVSGGTDFVTVRVLIRGFIRISLVIVGLRHPSSHSIPIRASEAFDSIWKVPLQNEPDRVSTASRTLRLGAPLGRDTLPVPLWGCGKIYGLCVHLSVLTQPWTDPKALLALLTNLAGCGFGSVDAVAKVAVPTAPKHSEPPMEVRMT